MLIVDIEVYRNYFLALFKEPETGRTVHFELFSDHELNRERLQKTMASYTTVSFNGLSYDLPLITAAIEGWTNEELYRFSKNIIISNKPSWTVCKEADIHVPAWDHIDLINVAPGIASLKVYGGRMNAPKMQDLPIDPDDEIRPKDHRLLREYCENDVDTTALLYETLTPQIKLRELMSEQYGIDLRSKSDAQIAEAVIKSELQKKMKKRFYRPEIKEGRTVRYQDPGIVAFENPELNAIFGIILDHEFEFDGGGKIKLPKVLKTTKIEIGEGRYSLGIGGLHSNEKSQYVEAGDGVLCEWDVASYYPSIILGQKLAPKSMGEPFLEFYKGLVERRLDAKEKMQKIAKEIKELEKELDLLKK